jgi:tetratricopeptide (TPR) repeat protein
VATAQKLRFSAVGGVLVGELERAAKLAPDHPDVQRELGLALARAGAWTAAREALSRVLWENDREMLLPLIYSVSLCRTGEEAEAVAVMREIVRRYPEGWMQRFALPGAGRIVHRPPALADTAADPQRNDLLGIGRGLLTIGAPDAALSAYEAHLLDQPASSAAELGRGLSLYYLDRREEAETAFRRAAELDPADAAPLYWLGSLRAAAGAPEEAYRIWDDAFARDPDHLRLRKTLTEGPIRNDTGAKPADVQYLAKYFAMLDADPVVKVGVLQEAVGRAPDNISLARDLAMNLRLCGRDREAAQASRLAIERADRKGKQRGWNYAHYAVLLAESDDPEVRDPAEALAVALRGIEAEDTPYGQVARGIALHRLGRYEEAVDALEGASTVKIERNLYLAMARLRSGDRSGAEKELDASLLTIANTWKGRPLPRRVLALQSEACGLLGRAVPEHR